MPSTCLSLHCQVVFGTKNREAVIAPEWRARLDRYPGGTIRGLGGVPESAGGVADPEHVLLGLKAPDCLVDFMLEVRRASSAWVHERIGLRAFAWQDGCLRSLQDRLAFGIAVRGWRPRHAPPPANKANPSGVRPPSDGVLPDVDAEVVALAPRRQKTRAPKQAMMRKLPTDKTRVL